MMDSMLYCQDSDIDVPPPAPFAHVYGPDNNCIGRCCAPPSLSLFQMAELRTKLREDRKKMAEVALKDGILIRPFEKRDQPAVATLYKEGLTSYKDDNVLYKLQCWYVDSKLEKGGDMNDIYTYYIQQSELLDRMFWVAEVVEGENVGDIVGCVAAMKHDDYVSTSTNPTTPRMEEEKALELVRMSVDEKYRKMKLGSRLVQTFQNFAQERKYKIARLSTLDLMVPAKKLYMSAGYELQSTRDLDVSTFLEGLTEDDIKVIRICSFYKKLSS